MESLNVTSSTDLIGIFALMGKSFFLGILIGCIFRIIVCWKIYQKCGKPGWAALIPIYDSWVFLELGGLPGWLSIIPVANGVGMLVATFKIAKRFDKGFGFGLGMLLLPLIFYGILAFGKAQDTLTKNDAVDKMNQGFEQAPINNVVMEIKESVPDLMAAPEIEASVNTVDTSNDKEEIIESSALNTGENMMDNSFNSLNENVEVQDDTPVVEEAVNVFDMPALAFENTEVKSLDEKLNNQIDSLDVQSEAIMDTSLNVSAVDTLEVPVMEEASIEILENSQVLDMPKMANEAINESITEVRECPNCAFKNNYSNKICEMCGSTLY